MLEGTSETNENLDTVDAIETSSTSFCSSFPAVKREFNLSEEMKDHKKNDVLFISMSTGSPRLNARLKFDLFTLSCCWKI